jgi:hypothetical protein
MMDEVKNDDDLSSVWQAPAVAVTEVPMTTRLPPVVFPKRLTTRPVDPRRYLLFAASALDVCIAQKGIFFIQNPLHDCSRFSLEPALADNFVTKSESITVYALI